MRQHSKAVCVMNSAQKLMSIKTLINVLGICSLNGKAYMLVSTNQLSLRLEKSELNGKKNPTSSTPRHAGKAKESSYFSILARLQSKPP